MFGPLGLLALVVFNESTLQNRVSIKGPRAHTPLDVYAMYILVTPCLKYNHDDIIIDITTNYFHKLTGLEKIKYIMANVGYLNFLYFEFKYH